MKKTQIQDKMKNLKSVIKRMNLDTLELINASAEIELKLRNSKISIKEIIEIENRINNLVNKYNFNK